MLRKLHSLPGLVAALLLLVLAITGVILSVVPAIERSAASIPATGELSVAELAERVVAHYPGTEQIQRSLSGEVVVYYSRDRQPGADLVNPLTGEGIAPYQPSAFLRWVKNLHRSFLLDDAGRILAGGLAVVMVLMCLSGMFLLARRMGGWKAILRPIAGTGSSRVHAELARFAVIGLLLSALTGSYMSAVRFGLLPEAANAEPSYPAEVSGGTPAPVSSLIALKNVDANELRELVFPYPDDPSDVYSLNTTQGAGFVDQSTGELLQYQPRSAGNHFHHWMVRLHTGEGLWWLGLVLGMAALTVPALSFTGMRIWWQRRSSSVRLDEGASIETADVVILVGSEGNTTWGFARDLQRKLNQAGKKVHCAPMNDLAEHYPLASVLFVLASTYGDGGAPSSASQFMTRLKHFQADDGLKFVVLGFGDQQFPKFCQYALDVDAALGSKGLQQMHPVTRIDRGSALQFREWGEAISKHMGVSLALTHNPAPAVTSEFELVERVDYGVAVQAPTSILRFKPVQSRRSLWQVLSLKSGLHLPSFEAGDLFGVSPPEDQTARLYSLASSASDGQLEICVRKQTNGLCSGYLHSLKPGDRITGFIQQNPGFRPAGGATPIILVGAGAGIGPLAGFIRKNTDRNPMYLYWGGRNPQSDFLYQPELGCYLNDHRLTGLNTAFSRSAEKAYVQDAIVADETALRQLIEKGAQVLVCGGRDMASGVSQVFDSILKPLHLNVDELKTEGRYLEDVY
ncbi:sulfite reductase (NADPH) flavoprotein alpha-component [Marinobacter antarcticus]|uniref:NADPH--hemoprotein reductase n=1 Tax=Marinobacter antarcticus TaxID=564117 RepID=A0A1M6UCM3_9GAMM|nr:PepSY domain-containing protein [Marinobacter antarcticus]SHK66920.1 sulfite reductase (NADPH) flavoprotein alpha-component [Marinobacter antarcticus]